MENFYVIVGSAAGALIGLQFVVVTLIADSPALRVTEGIAAFATPTIVHFGVVLFLSAVASVPWHEIGIVSVVWGLVGLSGIVYAVIVSRRLRVQTIYQPVFEDWLFMFCFHLRRMQCWLDRHTWFTPMRAQLYSSLALRRCCSSLLAFTMPGTPSRTTYLSRSVNNGRLSSLGENHRNQRETHFYCWRTHAIKSKE
jgi:hypothetical protein